MLLVVETGLGLSDANSYIEIADVERYLPSSMYDKFSELEELEKIDRMIIASMFINYSFNWLGLQKTIEQGLSWPRTNVFFQGHKIPDDYIPIQIKKASVMALNLIMQFGINFFQENGKAQVKRQKLGIIETEYFEALKANFIDNTEYQDINNMLRGLFKKEGNENYVAEVFRR